MAPQLSIIVYKSDPVDLQTTRHTALFVSEGNGATGILLHVTDASGFFNFEQHPGIDSRYLPAINASSDAPESGPS